MTPTPAGQLQHRVTIARRNENHTNELGETIAQDEQTQIRWAKIESLDATKINVPGAERIEDATHRVTLRYTSDLSPRDKLIFKGRTFQIDHLLNVEERDIELIVYCHSQE